MNAIVLPLLYGGALGATASLVPLWLGRLPARHARQRARAALDAAGALVGLVAQLQQHRGMSGAWRAGDASFAARLPQRQQAIDALFARARGALAGEALQAVPCFPPPRLEACRQQWHALVAALPGLSVEESFRAHSELVETLLAGLAALGEARLAPALPARIDVRNFARRLPALAECLGQARALGSAVAAGGHCTPLARVRLEYLVARADTLFGRACAAAGEAARGEVDAAVARLLATVREGLLGSDPTGLPAAEFFAIATRAVDGVFDWLEGERERLAAALAA